MTNEVFTYQGSEITFQLESGSIKLMPLKWLNRSA